MSHLESNFFDFAVFVNNLESAGTVERYANACGTSVLYLTKHLKHKRKIPRKDLMISLAKNSNERFSYSDLVKWFYGLEQEYIQPSTKNMIKKGVNNHVI